MPEYGTGSDFGSLRKGDLSTANRMLNAFHVGKNYSGARHISATGSQAGSDSELTANP
jgi:hypothetical protein